MQRDLVKMSKVQMMRSFVNQRLTAAAEEIFDLFERTIVEYEEQLHRSKEKQSNLLDDHRHHVRLQVSEVQQLRVRNEEEVPSEQQARRSRLDQEDPPEPPQIKEEQEELWSSQEREQLQGPEEADTSVVPFFRVPMKTEEDDGEKPQCSQLNENQTEKSRDIEYLKTGADGEDCGGSEPDRDFNPDSHLQPVSPNNTLHLSGSDTDDSSDCEEREEPQEGLNPLQNKDLPVSDMNCNTGNTSVSSSECATSFGRKEQLQKNKEINRREKPFSSSVCGERHQPTKHLQNHMIRPSIETPLSCSVCKRSFNRKSQMVTHMRVHTGEKPFSCSVCGKMFSRHENLKRHYVVHTEEKPFGCSVCGKRFAQRVYLSRHSVVHTGEKPFRCIVCNQRFTQLDVFRKHKCFR
ncbi:zinc finger protein 135-like isoform X6 [Labrus mixtus]|uniref:zinc finger protein 135-like isoform X6 n=1 Tax=Labrus mixtus TaxID=508554 RepID=UPI0029BFBD04|nr:zinc finger protein 135-like isoform X6 [Labrus mixtus]